jgi:hypothetical protein
MKTTAIITHNEHDIDNLSDLLELFTDNYSPNDIYSILNGIIYEYSNLNIKELSSQGESTKRGLEVVDELHVLKLLADSIRKIKVVSTVEKNN